MIPKYTKKEYNKTKPKDKLKLECEYCHKIFWKEKFQITREIKCRKEKIKKGTGKYHRCRFCSIKCLSKFQFTKQLVQCKQCNKKFYKKAAECKKCPNHFCSSSCAATYHNKNKTTGFRRSKTEKWIEKQLLKSYPKLKILFNDRKTIKYELDVYVPKLKLAVELNGIVHYKPIYGKEKFKKIKQIDKFKINECKRKKIKLMVVDISFFTHFKKALIQPILDKIKHSIDKK